MNAAALVESEFLRRHPLEAAEALEAVPARTLKSTVQSLAPDALAVALEFSSPPRALAIFEALAPEDRKSLVERAAPRLAVSLVAQLAPDSRDSLLAELAPVARKDIERMLTYREDSAGRLMDRSFLGARADMSVGEVLRRLQETTIRGARSLFVITADGRLSGRVDVQDLAMAAADTPVSELVHVVDLSVTPETGREELVELLERSLRDSVPVVDVTDQFLGVVRYRNLFRAIEVVATADMQKMVGVSPDERALSKPSFAIRRRLPWLHVNLLTAFLAASVVGLFESLIAQFTVLAILMPVVAGQSGNAGAQALAVTIRGLALREVGIRQWRAVLTKEVLVGLTNGLALAASCGLAVYLWSGTLGLALIIGVAMIMSILAAGIAGAVVPLILTRFGQDPAVASSIIQTTITDVFGFFSFLGTAMLLSFML